MDNSQTSLHLYESHSSMDDDLMKWMMTTHNSLLHPSCTGPGGEGDARANRLCAARKQEGVVGRLPGKGLMILIPPLPLTTGPSVSVLPSFCCHDYRAEVISAPPWIWDGLGMPIRKSHTITNTEMDSLRAFKVFPCVVALKGTCPKVTAWDGTDPAPRSHTADELIIGIS